MFSFVVAVSAFKWLALPIILVGAGAFYKYYPDVKQDNFIEEIFENIILAETGIDIDLSPDTKEKDSIG